MLRGYSHGTGTWHPPGGHLEFMESFEECFDGRKYEDRVAQDLIDGNAAGITGTPSFTINGILQIVGNEPWPSIQQKIDAALAAAGN